MQNTANLGMHVADGCFGLQFLIHLLSRQTLDDNRTEARFNVPAEWCATRPSYWCALRGEFDIVPINQRFIKQKGAFSVDMLQSIKGVSLFTGFAACISIKDLHGPAYKESAHCLSQTVPGIYDGGVLWEPSLSSGNSGAVLCSEHVASAAVAAATCNSRFLELSFADCGFEKVASHCRILTEMSKLCLHNTTLNSIVFPPRFGFQWSPHKHGGCLVKVPPLVSPAEQQQYVAAWVAIGEAITRNPRPLFVSLGMADCCMGDAGLTSLLPGLRRLYQQLGLSPRLLNFSGNLLSAASVSYVCTMLTEPISGWCVNLSWLQELSFGNNPWCNAPNIDAMCAVLRKASSLRVLDLSSVVGAFPTPQLKDALDQSLCPLRSLTLGGYAIDPAYAVRCFFFMFS